MSIRCRRIGSKERMNPMNAHRVMRTTSTGSSFLSSKRMFPSPTSRRLRLKNVIAPITSKTPCERPTMMSTNRKKRQKTYSPSTTVLLSICAIVPALQVGVSNNHQSPIPIQRTTWTVPKWEMQKHTHLLGLLWQQLLLHRLQIINHQRRLNFLHPMNASPLMTRLAYLTRIISSHSNL